MAAAPGAAMKSISIMWAEGVTEAEAATVVETVRPVHRLRGIPEEAERLTALRRLAIHNFGHVLEIPREGRASVVQSGPVRHCTNPCAMGAADQIADLRRSASAEPDLGLCPE